MTHEAVRRAKLAEMLGGTFARSGREVAEAIDATGCRVSTATVEWILAGAIDELLGAVDVAGFREDDEADPDAALDAARDAAAGVL